MTSHRAHHSVEATLHRGGILAILVLQDVCGLAYPFVGAFDVRPELAGLLQARLDQAA
jgi:hypothetical protein